MKLVEVAGQYRKCQRAALGDVESPGAKVN